MKKLLALIALLTTSPANAETLTATVYHPWYAGRQDACNGRYDHWGVSVAHPTLPCGTKLRISRNGHSIVTRVWDRCNCNLDLSAGAAYKLGIPLDGIGRVNVVVY
jgi:rare lipoprotein A